MNETRPPAISYRAATPDDEPFLVDLRKETMDEHMKQAGMSVDDDMHLKRVRYRYEDARIICVDGVCAGLLKTYRTTEEQYLLQLQIAPRYQGGRIGAAVLRDVIAEANVHRLPVGLSVLKRNPAKRLYERCGFEVIGEGEFEFRMRRPYGLLA